MPNIGEINIRNIGINEIPLRNLSTPTTNIIGPPVTVDIGTPIVDIPGCVKARNNTKNTQLIEDDPKGNLTLCDGNIPYYEPIDYSPEELIITRPAETPKVNPPKAPELPQTPDTSNTTPPATAKVDCPTPAQEAKEPVGTFVEGFRKKVVEYKLMGDECVQITEEVPLPRQIVAGLPSGGQVVQVGGVAVIATTSALLAKPLADLLLKAVKPAVKKVMKKIAAIRGKKPPILSSGERRAEQRQMNHAIMELRSVFPRKKRKKKG